MKKNIDRRTFLFAGSAAIALSATYPFRSRISRFFSRAAGSGRFIFSPSMEFSGTNTLCSFVDLNTHEVHGIEVPLQQAHSAAFRPGNADRIFVFDASGPLACEVSLSERRCVRTFHGEAGNSFGGHGVFLGDTLFTSEARPDGEGRIVGRDGDTLKIVFSFPSAGGSPHEIGLSPDKANFVVMNEGGGGHQHGKKKRSNISFVDVKTGAVNFQSLSPSGARKYRHFAASSDGGVCVAAKQTEVTADFNQDYLAKLIREKEFRAAYEYRNKMSRYLPTPMIFFPSGKRAEVDVEPADGVFLRMSDTNSICIDEERNIVGASHSTGRSVTFWDATNHRLISEHQFGNLVPRGIVFHKGQNCFFLHTMDQGLFRFAHPASSPERLAGIRLPGYAHLTLV